MFGTWETQGLSEAKQPGVCLSRLLAQPDLSWSGPTEWSRKTKQKFAHFIYIKYQKLAAGGSRLIRTNNTKSKKIQVNFFRVQKQNNTVTSINTHLKDLSTPSTYPRVQIRKEHCMPLLSSFTQLPQQLP